jgi:hypothetical protein
MKCETQACLVSVRLSLGWLACPIRGKLIVFERCSSGSFHETDSSVCWSTFGSNSGFENIFQEIMERRSPDEHAVRSTGQDSIGMLDICLL